MVKEQMKRIYINVEIKAVDIEGGTVDALIPMSTGAEDRMNEVINPSAFKKHLKSFMKRPVLVSSHDYWDLRKQIGHFLQLEVTDAGLLGKPQWYVNMGNEEADWAFQLAAMNMAAFSVGFIPLKYTEGDGKENPYVTYEEVELLEISQVIVPANRETIQGLKADTEKFELLDPVAKQLLESAEKNDKLWNVEIPEGADLDFLEAQAAIGNETKDEETEDFIRIKNPKDDKAPHSDHDIKTIGIDKDKGISALYCVDDKVITTYLFAKAKDWTMEKAKEWVEEHAKNIELVEVTTMGSEAPEFVITMLAETKTVTQVELRDEIDYLTTSIKAVGLSEENWEPAIELVRNILPLTGGDIPDDIALGKAGAVLSSQNKKDIQQAFTLLEGVLSRSEHAEEQQESFQMPDKEELLQLAQEVIAERKTEAEPTKEQIAEVVREVIGELTGKVK